MSSIIFSKQKWAGVNNTRRQCFTLLYSISDDTLQDNATFVEQSLNIEVVSYFFRLILLTNFMKIIEEPLGKRHRFCMHCVPFISLAVLRVAPQRQGQAGTLYWSLVFTQRNKQKPKYKNISVCLTKFLDFLLVLTLASLVRTRIKGELTLGKAWK